MKEILLIMAESAVAIHEMMVMNFGTLLTCLAYAIIITMPFRWYAKNRVKAGQTHEDDKK